MAGGDSKQRGEKYSDSFESANDAHAKKIPCRFHSKKGGCRYGSRCRFAHTDDLEGSALNTNMSAATSSGAPANAFDTHSIKNGVVDATEAPPGVDPASWNIMPQSLKSKILGDMRATTPTAQTPRPVPIKQNSNSSLPSSPSAFGAGATVYQQQQQPQFKREKPAFQISSQPNRPSASALGPGRPTKDAGPSKFKGNFSSAPPQVDTAKPSFSKTALANAPEGIDDTLWQSMPIPLRKKILTELSNKTSVESTSKGPSPASHSDTTSKPGPTPKSASGNNTTGREASPASSIGSAAAFKKTSSSTPLSATYGNGGADDSVSTPRAQYIPGPIDWARGPFIPNPKPIIRIAAKASQEQAFYAIDPMRDEIAVCVLSGKPDKVNFYSSTEGNYQFTLSLPSIGGPLTYDPRRGNLLVLLSTTGQIVYFTRQGKKWVQDNTSIELRKDVASCAEAIHVSRNAQFVGILVKLNRARAEKIGVPPFVAFTPQGPIVLPESFANYEDISSINASDMTIVKMNKRIFTRDSQSTLHEISFANSRPDSMRLSVGSDGRAYVLAHWSKMKETRVYWLALDETESQRIRVSTKLVGLDDIDLDIHDFVASRNGVLFISLVESRMNVSPKGGWRTHRQIYRVELHPDAQNKSFHEVSQLIRMNCGDDESMTVPSSTPFFERSETSGFESARETLPSFLAAPAPGPSSAAASATGTSANGEGQVATQTSHMPSFASQEALPEKHFDDKQLNPQHEDDDDIPSWLLGNHHTEGSLDHDKIYAELTGTEYPFNSPQNSLQSSVSNVSGRAPPPGFGSSSLPPHLSHPSSSASMSAGNGDQIHSQNSLFSSANPLPSPLDGISSLSLQSPIGLGAGRGLFSFAHGAGSGQAFTNFGSAFAADSSASLSRDQGVRESLRNAFGGSPSLTLPMSLTSAPPPPQSSQQQHHIIAPIADASNVQSILRTSRTPPPGFGLMTPASVGEYHNDSFPSGISASSETSIDKNDCVYNEQEPGVAASQRDEVLAVKSNTLSTLTLDNRSPPGIGAHAVSNYGAQQDSHEAQKSSATSTFISTDQAPQNFEEPSDLRSETNSETRMENNAAGIAWEGLAPNHHLKGFAEPTDDSTWNTSTHAWGSNVTKEENKVALVATTLPPPDQKPSSAGSKSSQTSLNECPICFEQMDEPRRLLVPGKCGHCFHRTCIVSHMAQSDRSTYEKCPVCAEPIHMSVAFVPHESPKEGRVILGHKRESNESSPDIISQQQQQQQQQQQPSSITKSLGSTYASVSAAGITPTNTAGTSLARGSSAAASIKSIAATTTSGASVQTKSSPVSHCFIERKDLDPHHKLDVTSTSEDAHVLSARAGATKSKVMSKREKREKAEVEARLAAEEAKRSLFASDSEDSSESDSDDSSDNEETENASESQAKSGGDDLGLADEKNDNVECEEVNVQTENLDKEKEKTETSDEDKRVAEEESNPQFLRAKEFKEQGDHSMRTKSYRKAMEWYEKSISAYPSSSMFRNAAGFCELARKNYNVAERLFNKSLGLNPNNAEAYVGLGRSAMQQGNLQASFDHFKKAIELSTNAKELCEDDLKDVEQALDKLGRAKHHKDNGKLKKALAVVREGLKLVPQAQELLQLQEDVKVAKDVLDAASMVAKIWSHIETGTDLPGALDLVHKLKERTPQRRGSAEVWYLSGAIAEKAEDYDTAMIHFDRAYMKDPNYHERLSAYASAAKSLQSGRKKALAGEHEAAIREYEAGKSSCPKDMKWLACKLILEIAASLGALNKVPQAKKAFSEAVECLPMNFSTYMAKIEYFEKQGDVASLFEAFTTAREGANNVADVSLAASLSSNKRRLLNLYSQKRRDARIEERRTKCASYYRILGLENLGKNASEDQIRDSYRETARSYLVNNLNKEDESVVKQNLQDLSEAFAILSDPLQRRRYDDGTMFDNEIFDPEHFDVYIREVVRRFTEQEFSKIEFADLMRLFDGEDGEEEDMDENDEYFDEEDEYDDCYGDDYIFFS